MAALTGLLPPDQLAKRLFWQEASPFIRTLGAEIAVDGDIAQMRIRPLARLAMPGGSAIDPLAGIGLMDDCLSLSIGKSVPADRGIATLDLWFCALRREIKGECVARANYVGAVGDLATARIELRDARGIVMHGGGNFLLGRFPSGEPGDPEHAGRFSPDGYRGPFRETIGLREAGPCKVSMVGSDAVIGWEAGPIVHGGAVAIALFEAAQRTAPDDQFVRTISLRYLSPAAHRGVVACAQIDRPAKRACHLSASATVEGKMVATATAVTAPD